MANSMSLKILAEMQSGNVVKGLNDIRTGLDGVKSAAERSSKALESIEQHQRAMAAAADAARELARQQAAVAQATRDKTREDVAAIKQVKLMTIAYDHAASALSRVGQHLSTLGGAGVRYISEALKMSSHFTEQTNELEISFGRNASAADKWSRRIGAALGKGEVRTREVMTKLQTNLAPALGSDQAFNYAKRLTMRAIDLGSFKDIDPSKVADNLISGLQGIVTPMKKYAAAPLVGYLQQFENVAAQKEGRKSRRYLDMNLEERTKLRADYMLDRTSQAVGDAERTAGTAANTMLRFATAVQDLKTKLGGLFVEALLPFIRALADLAQWFSALDPQTQRFIGLAAMLTTGLALVGGVLLGVLLPAFLAYTVAQNAAIAAGTTLQASMSGVASSFVKTAGKMITAIAPVALALAGIILIVGILADLWGPALADGFRKAWKLVLDMASRGLDTLITVAAGVYGVLTMPVNLLLTGLSKLLGVMSAIAAKSGMAKLAADMEGAAYLAQAGAEAFSQAGAQEALQKSKGAAVDWFSGIDFAGMGESIGHGLMGMVKSSAAGWGKILGELGISNNPLLPWAKDSGSSIEALGSAGRKESRQERNARAAYARDALPMYMTSDYQTRRQEQDRWRDQGAFGDLSLKFQPGIDAFELAKQANEAEKAAAKKKADNAEIQAKWVIIENEAAFRAQRRAASALRRFGDAMANMWQDIASEILGRVDRLAQGDVAGAFRDLGAKIGGFVEAAGVPFAGAIGAALDGLVAIITAPINRIASGLLAGENASAAVSNAASGATAGAVAAGAFPPLTGLAGPVGIVTAALLTMSTQTREFTSVASMVDEGFRRMVEPLGAFWEALYPVAGMFMQIGSALGPVLGAFLMVAQALVPVQFLGAVVVTLTKYFLSYIAIVSAVYAVFVGLWSLLQAFGYIIGLLLFGPTGMAEMSRVLGGLLGVFTSLHDAVIAVAVGIIRAAAGLIDGLEAALHIDIKGEGALKKLANSLEKANEDINGIDWGSGKEEADKFLAQDQAASTEQNINLPEAFKLAAARAAATDANGNGSWGSGAGGARGDMPIDRFQPTINLTVMVNGVTQESAMEYADKSRGFRQLVESGIVMARQTPSLDPGRGRRNRN